jgi:hypothetical protein
LILWAKWRLISMADDAAAAFTPAMSCDNIQNQ